mgnify:CR=1 FL=1
MVHALLTIAGTAAAFCVLYTAAVAWVNLRAILQPRREAKRQMDLKILAERLRVQMRADIERDRALARALVEYEMNE